VFGVAFAVFCKGHDNKLEGTNRNLITSVSYEVMMIPI
jgi:hypothetical protein